MMRKILFDRRMQIGFLAFAAAVLIPTLLGLPAASGQSAPQGDAGLPAGPAFAQDQPQPGVPPTQKPDNVPAIMLTKTVGTDPSTCATTHSITLPAWGGQVTYCFTVTNSGGVVLTRHGLIDDQLGLLLDDFPYNLEPYTSYAITHTATIVAPTTNTATWVAIGGGQTVWAVDSATVTLEPPAPAIVLTKTVGLDPAVCATTNTQVVLAGTEVVYCYRVRNTGNIAFDFHDLYDDPLGLVLFHWPAALAPGATLAITHAVPITATTTNEGTWTAFRADGLWATDSDTATVRVTSIDPNIVVDPAGVYAIQPPDQVTTHTLSIANTGLSPLEWTVEESLTPGCECPFDVSWLAASPISGTTSSATSDAVQVVVDSTGLPFAQYYESALCIHSNDPDPGPGNGTSWVIVPASLITAVPDAVTASELSAASAAAGPPHWLLLITVPAAGILALAAGRLGRQRRQPREN